jgi:protein-S-isoprenylcysteine O-methyltransferase Ste14
VPAWLRAAALIALTIGWALTFWAMRVNRFFSSVVRIQSDRGQYVVTSGPYRWMRHPGYLAGIAIIVASGIALGSWLATAILIVCGLPFLLRRAITEDRVLQAELPGYRDYAARVRWRVLPGIW